MTLHTGKAAPAVQVRQRWLLSLAFFGKAQVQRSCRNVNLRGTGCSGAFLAWFQQTKVN